MVIEAAKSLICEAGRRLVTEGLVSGTWGNLSLKVGDDLMVITPSGAEYEALQPDDIVEVTLSDGVARGGRPSSEGKLHRAIYRNRADIGAVIHTHSPNASTVAAARREVPPVLDDLAQIAGPTIRVADYALPSTGKLVRKTLKALRGRRAALMANHGAVCLGRDLEEALLCCRVLEKGCRAFIEAEFLGGAKGINRAEAALMHQFYLRKYSKRRKE